MIFSKKCFLGYSICVFITWLSRICIEVCTIKIYNESRYEDYLIAYTSPTIVLCALFIFFAFKNLNINHKSKIIKFVQHFAPVTFGVYLFQEAPMLRQRFIEDAFTYYISFDAFKMLFAVIGTALMI